MGGGGGSSSQASNKIQVYGAQISSSCYGNAIPIVFGRDRISANLIWKDDLTGIFHWDWDTDNSSGGGGGKGGGGGDSGPGYTRYWTTAYSLMFAICEGPAKITRIWKDKEVGSATSFGFTVLNGARTQSPWTYIETKHPDKALSYPGTVLACHPQFDCGKDGSLGNWTFEVDGYCAPAAYDPRGPVYPDAYPDRVVTKLLTDPYISNLWPASYIGDLDQYRRYCIGAGFFISLSMMEQQTALEWIQEILDATNSDAVWSCGGDGMTLKILPYGDTYLSGKDNDGTIVYYEPNLTPIYDLGPDDFIVSSPDDDPVQVTRTAQNDTYNSIPIEICDRALDYNTNTIDNPDQSDIDLYGLRKADPTTMHLIKRASMASAISRIKVQKSIYCKNTYTFQLGWKYILLDGMDLVTITEPGLGLDHKLVRITEIAEDDNGLLSVTAEETLIGIHDAAMYETETGDGASFDVNIDPGFSNAPDFIVPPTVLTGGETQIWMASSGGPYWAGALVHISVDGGQSYTQMGSVTGMSRHGYLTAPLPAWTGSGIDNTNTLSVDLGLCTGTLATVQPEERNDLATLCWVDGELLSYQSATLTGPNQYNLTGLKRGAYYTSSAAVHPKHGRFIRLDTSLYKYTVTPSRLNQPIAVKLQSFNIYGAGLKNLDACPVYWCSAQSGSVTLGASITNLVFSSVAGQLGLKWDAVNIPGVEYEIRVGSSWEASTVLGRVDQPSYQTLYDGTYWIAPLYGGAYGNPTSIALSGVTRIANVVQAWDEDATGWSGLNDPSVLVENGTLTLNGIGTMSDVTSMANVPMMLAIGGFAPSGVYEVPSSHIVDIDTAQFCTVSIQLDSSYMGTSSRWSDIPDFSACPSIAGNYAGITFIQPQIALAQNDGVFGEWMNFQPGQQFARKFKMRLLLTTSDPTVTPVINQWAWTVDMPDKIQRNQNGPVTIPTTGLTITYPVPFQVTPAVTTGELNAQTGDYKTISGSTNTGFTIQYFNASGTGVTRNINWSAIAY